MEKMEKMDHPKLRELNHAQLERLCFIDFRLMFLGTCSRIDVMNRYKVALAVPTRDFSCYRELAPENLEFDGSKKIYRPTKNFKPLFDHNPYSVLVALTTGGSTGQENGLLSASNGYLTSIPNLHLNLPNLNVLAALSRAINEKKVVSVTYYSYTVGLSKRNLIPYALFESGTRWCVRAFCRLSQQFKNFAINRIDDPVLLDDEIKDNELPQNDHQWLRMLSVELVPHPAAMHPDIVERDYGMKNGKLELNLRAAIAGYVLRHFSVDCSQDAFLDPVRYRLWLKNADKVLFAVESAFVTPGYNSSLH
jgi:WYL domain